MLTGLQTTLTAEDNGCPMETVPLRFIATDDGRTLFAFTENEDGMLEIMTAPVTLMASNGASASLIKHLDGNLIVHPQPVFQISVEDVGHCDGRTEGTNEIQGTVSLVPAQTVQDNLSVVTETSMDTKAAHIQNLLPVQGEATPDKKATIREGPIFGRGEKNRYKRSPGRPKKNEIRSNQSMEPLRCDICQQEFNKQSLYRKHMESHAEEKPHRCPKCPASFNIPTNFTLHMATHNTGDPKCPECGRKFARMASLKSHMLLHEKEENLFCTECEDAFSTKAQLDAHLKLHGEKWSGEETRKCKLCNKQFTQPALYRLHIREHYRLQTKVSKQTKRGAKHKTMYKCTICLKSFQKPSQLMRHIRVHTGEKPFKCTICGRAFTQKSSLQIHTWQHNGIRPHTCDLCNAKFSQKGNLNAHILRVHNAPEGEPIYGCTYCSCVFKKFGSLNGHIKRMHSNVNEDRGDRDDENGKNESDMHATVDSVISQLVSLESVGNDNDNSTAALHEHRPTDTVNGNDILQQALKNSGLPSKNKITDDGNSETSKADSRTNFVTLLDRTPDGGTRKYLTIRQRCVGNVRWYACSFCHKEFKKPSDLIRHLRVHTQEKPFKCTHCFRSFALKSTMIAHERTHTGTKKYSCLSCDKTFACHGSLAAHNRLQHGKPSDKPEEGWPRNGTEEPSRPATTKTGSRSRPKLPAEAETIVAQLVLQEPLVITETGNRISVAQAASKQRRACDSGETSDVARPHRCWVCHASFRKVSHLKQHYRRHTGERPYRCTTCDRRFTSNSVLKSHLHTHEDARPYGCSVCGTKFSTQSSMKRHLVTHSNKRPYMCPYCHKTFKTYVNCRKHMKIHRHELAQRQLEQQQKSHEGKEVVSVLPGNLNLSETINVSFQPEISEEFTEGFTEQLECIADKNKSLIATETPSSTIVNQTLPDISTTGLAGTQMLNADETGTVTIPNYSGDQTLTPESMREIEETLNQQLFNIGMNLGLGNNLIRQIDDGATVDISGARDQRVLNVIYENNNNKNNIGSSSVFASQFDSFDMSQIALQADPGIDLGLVETTTSASMASILPRSVKEQHRFVPVTGNGEIVSPIGTTTTATTTTTTGSAVTTATIGTGETGTRTIFLKPAGSVCFQKDVDIQGHQTVLVEEANQIPEENCVATGQFQDPAEGTTGDVVVNTKETTTNDLGDTCNRTRCESLLQCHICNEQGFTAAGLKEHLKTHRGSKEYQCGECSMRFCTNGGLSRHTKVHGGRQQWRCLVCQRTLSSKSQLRVHSKCHEFSVNDRSATGPGTIIEVVVSPPAMDPDSSISEKVLLDTVAEKQVMDQKTETRKEEPREYTNRCRFCPKTFRKPSDLIRHTRTHTGERPYKCDFCSKCFAVKCTLDSHTKVHTGKKTFRCHVCSSLFATKGSLKVHMRLHTGSKPFRCTICDLRFRTSGHRKVHLLKHAREHKPGTSKRRQKHLKVAAIAEVAADLEKSTKEKELTDENIVRDTNYQNYQTIDVADTGPNLTEQISFNGDATTTTTTTTILNNNPVFSINENNQLVANLHFLFANGLVTIQTDDTVVQQPMTEQRAAETHVLVAPLQPEAVPVESQQPVHGIIQTDDQTAEHNSRKRTKAPSKRECDVCGKTFTKPYQVERHKRIHTGERPYKCDLCAKSFAQKSTLQMHQKHHTGDRPHPCPHCEYSFTQKGNLRTHVKRVHQLDTLDVRKLRRVRQTHHSYAPVKPVLPDIADTKILSFDDISFVELLK